MSYGELIQAYFERSTALQWYWTVYVLVIGGVLGFSTFRLRPETATAILVSVLYVCFAYKNLGAIEDTTHERAAFLTAIRDHVPGGPNAVDVRVIHDRLVPTLQPTEYGGLGGARNFHLACDLLTLAFVWAKEWHRRRYVAAPEAGAA